MGFRQLLDSSVRPIYDTRGRIHVAFLKLRLKRRGEVGLVVTVTVNEGDTYDLGEVRLEASHRSSQG